MNPKLHVSLEVNDLEQSLRFYSTLFNMSPTKTKPGYAKFDVAEPGVVLSLTQPAKAPCCVSGLSHLGVRVDSTEQVLAARDRLQKAGLATLDEINTTCCYAVQDKIWVQDPTGYRWEIYVFKGDTEEKYNAAHLEALAKGGCACGDEPATATTASCCS